MEFIQTRLNDVVIIEPKVFGDERGFFMESWSENAFANAGLDLNFVQDNHSRSSQGILRGLHYQTENTQGKLVRVTRGEVYDVAVDLRQSSSTYGQWVGVLLSEENHRMLWVPEGFAHGFYVTSDTADFLYKCTDGYNPNAEVSILWNDPDIGIEWPLVNGEAPALSGKDADGLSFKDAPKFD